jgi:hypothetical protein
MGVEGNTGGEGVRGAVRGAAPSELSPRSKDSASFSSEAACEGCEGGGGVAGEEGEGEGEVEVEETLIRRCAGKEMLS